MSKSLKKIRERATRAGARGCGDGDLGKEEGAWRRRCEAGRGEENKRRGRGLGPWDPVLLQDELPPSLVEGAKARVSVWSFEVTVVLQSFPSSPLPFIPAFPQEESWTQRSTGNAGISIVN